MSVSLCQREKTKARGTRVHQSINVMRGSLPPHLMGTRPFQVPILLQYYGNRSEVGAVWEVKNDRMVSLIDSKYNRGYIYGSPIQPREDVR